MWYESFIEYLSYVLSNSLNIMHILQWLLCLVVTSFSNLVQAYAIPLTEPLSTRADLNSTTTNATNAHLRNPGYKQNVLYGLSKAQIYAHSPTPVKVFDVRNRVIHGSSSNLADFTGIELDAIMPKPFRRPASFDVATLQSDFHWGRWRTSLINFQPIDSRRLDEGFTGDDFPAIMDEDEARSRLIAMGPPGTYFRKHSYRFDNVPGLMRRFTRIRSLDMSRGSLFNAERFLPTPTS